jgi:hypothetical protein
LPWIAWSANRKLRRWSLVVAVVVVVAARLKEQMNNKVRVNLPPSLWEWLGQLAKKA